MLPFFFPSFFLFALPSSFLLPNSYSSSFSFHPFCPFLPYSFLLINSSFFIFLLLSILILPFSSFYYPPSSLLFSSLHTSRWGSRAADLFDFLSRLQSLPLLVFRVLWPCSATRLHFVPLCLGNVCWYQRACVRALPYKYIRAYWPLRECQGFWVQKVPLPATSGPFSPAACLRWTTKDPWRRRRGATLLLNLLLPHLVSASFSASSASFRSSRCLVTGCSAELQQQQHQQLHPPQ